VGLHHRAQRRADSTPAVGVRTDACAVDVAGFGLFRARTS
jgi:hypothetical protein